MARLVTPPTAANPVSASVPLLQVSHVSRSFGTKRALDDVSLEVMPGDIFGFVGHNGAGKTTLIRSIVGVAGFDSGDIRIAGQSVRTDALACKRMCAYVPDNPDIYDFLTGIQYLNFMADVFEVPLDVRRARIRDYAERLGLVSDLGDLVSSYSHGMRQKLVLIGALLHDPALMVLDEPFVGLDPAAAHAVREILRELVGRGSAVFFSSHVLEVVEKLCDKVAIIKAGQVRACGLTAQVVGDESLEDVFLDMLDEGAHPAVDTGRAGRPGSGGTEDPGSRGCSGSTSGRSSADAGGPRVSGLAGLFGRKGTRR